MKSVLSTTRAVVMSCLLVCMPALADNASPDVVTYIDDTTNEPQSGSTGVQIISPLARTPVREQMSTQPSLGQPFQPMQENGISYITGGIGDEERNALDGMKSQYDLHVTSSSASGAFLGNVFVTIIDQSGHSLITVPAGPVFFANLPRGRYTVEARSEDQTKRQTVTITNAKAVNLHFSWQ